MSDANAGARFVRDRLNMLNEALRRACLTWGSPVDATIRAGLGYFILREARIGETDPQRLAEAAVDGLREDPDVLEDVDW